MKPLLLLLLSAGPTASPPLCDPSWLPISRDPASSALVVTILPDTVADVRSPRFVPQSPVREFEESLRGHRGPTRPRYGQRATVIEADRSVAVAPGSAVVLVPWQFVSDCGLAPWTASARWAPVGEAVFLTAWRRPRASWVGGMPTFDVEVRGWQPIWPQVWMRLVAIRRLVVHVQRPRRCVLCRLPSG